MSPKRLSIKILKHERPARSAPTSSASSPAPAKRFPPCEQNVKRHTGCFGPMPQTTRRGTKRKHEGNLARMRELQKKIERHRNRLRKQALKIKNENNSTSKKHRAEHRHSLDTMTLDGLSDIHSAYLGQPYTQRHPIFSDNPFFPPACPGNTPYGNPPLWQYEQMAYSYPPGNFGYPPHRACPAQSREIQHFMTPRVQACQEIGYTTLCHETPQVLGCGRWYRLKRQQDASREGFVPLLTVMFCCCCNDQTIFE